MLELRSITLTTDQTVFGKHGKQLSSSMEDLKLSYDGKKVTVVSRNFPGKQEWILPPLIGKMVWVDPELEERK
jgi:hypothetical protein